MALTKVKIFHNIVFMGEKERRRFKRKEALICVDYENAEQFLRDYAINISLGGIFLQTDSPLPVGTTLKLFFSIPELDDLIETTGEVVWVKKSENGNKGGMGIRFNDLTDEAKEKLERVLNLL